jgi:hypothetical protein
MMMHWKRQERAAYLLCWMLAYSWFTCSFTRRAPQICNEHHTACSFRT